MSPSALLVETAQHLRQHPFEPTSLTDSMMLVTRSTICHDDILKHIEATSRILAARPLPDLEVIARNSTVPDCWTGLTKPSSGGAVSAA